MTESGQTDPTATPGDVEALWLLAPRGPFEVRPIAQPRPGPDEVVVRVRAVALNPVDAIRGPLRRIVTPWVRYPTVIGTDVAGEVVAVGETVTRLGPGDRVVGFAAGQEKARNNAAEGGFQRYVRLLERVTTALPASISFEQAAVLPLGLATAAAGLYEPDQLALALPSASPAARVDEVVLVWGASTSVGCNAVQLAAASGYTVFATAGHRNRDLIRSLGAAEVRDYRDTHVDDDLVAAMAGKSLVGTIAIGQGSLAHALRIAHRAPGTKNIASVYPDPLTKVRAVFARTRGVHLSSIWGGTPIESAVGPAVFVDYLSTALAAGGFRPAPDPVTAGTRLDDIPAALDTLRGGVSASKLVVTIA